MILDNRGRSKKHQGQTALTSRGSSLAVGSYLQRGSAPPPPTPLGEGGRVHMTSWVRRVRRKTPCPGGRKANHLFIDWIITPGLPAMRLNEYMIKNADSDELFPPFQHPPTSQSSNLDLYPILLKHTPPRTSCNFTGGRLICWRPCLA